MINICVDGNHFFHKTFGVFAGYGNVDPGKVLAKKSDQAMFIRKVATDLCASLKGLPTGGRLIFTMDSRSWRKEIEIENGGYKSNRVKDENVDWTIFFDLMDEFGRQLEKQGFIYSRVEGAEGDDLLYWWARYFNDNGEDCIVISGDKDLHQLVNFNGKNWTITWNNNNKKNVVTAPLGWKENWLLKEEVASIFDMGSVISSDREKMNLLVAKTELNEISTDYFLMNKIFVGDDGDAVPSIWETKAGSKTMRFSQKKSDSLIQAIMESEDYPQKKIGEILENPDMLSWMAGFALRLMKDVDSSDNRIKLVSNIKRNCKLMWLEKSMIPDSVTSGMSDETERGISIPRKSITLDRIKILDGTNWITPNYSPSSFDPFSNFS